MTSASMCFASFVRRLLERKKTESKTANQEPNEPRIHLHLSIIRNGERGSGGREGGRKEASEKEEEEHERKVKSGFRRSPFVSFSSSFAFLFFLSLSLLIRVSVYS